jgi:hypothetical protein
VTQTNGFNFFSHYTTINVAAACQVKLIQVNVKKCFQNIKYFEYNNIFSDLKAETVHFEEHFEGEENHEEQVGDLLEVVQPRRLTIVLCCLKMKPTFKFKF